MFGVPRQSNKYNWGPWLQVAPPVGTTGTYSAGSTRVEFDDSLSPETFGGFVGLDEAGFALAKIDIGQVGVSETGMVELVGPPALNIGEQIQLGGPYVSDLDVSVGTDGVTHTYKFNTWTPTYGKLAKHNIELLSRIGTSSFQSRASAPSLASPIFKGTYGMTNITSRRIAKQQAKASKSSITRNDEGRAGDKDKADMIEFTTDEATR